MKARVLKVEHSTTSKGNQCSYIWALVDGCEIPGKLYAKGHVDYKKGDEIAITIEPNYRSMLEVKVVQ